VALSAVLLAADVVVSELPLAVDVAGGVVRATRRMDPALGAVRSCADLTVPVVPYAAAAGPSDHPSR